MTEAIFTGAATALITPFCNGLIDFDAYGTIVDAQINAGIGGLVVSGTTGESATLSDEEKEALFAFTVRRTDRRIPVIAGTGTNSTAHAVRLSEAAARTGCDGLLVVTPYYNKASAEGLYEHYSRIADRCQLPVTAYNVPSRTGVNIPVPVLCRLFKNGSVQAVKEASGDLSRVALIAAACPGMTIYSGNDDQILPVMSLGGRGVISVLSNLLPGEVQKICTDYLGGDHKSALEAQLRYLPLINRLFSDVNPIPVKYMMSRLGYCRPEYRLPLTPPGAGLKAELDDDVRALVVEPSTRAMH